MGKNIHLKEASAEDRSNSSLKDIPFMILTFLLVLVGWVFFRASTVNDAVYIIKKIVSDFSLSDISLFYPKRLVIVLCFVFVEWIQKHKSHPLKIDNYPYWARIAIYYFIVAVILMWGVYNYTPFIYFQF